MRNPKFLYSLWMKIQRKYKERKMITRERKLDSIIMEPIPYSVIPLIAGKVI